jgi:hypothetical protein
MCSRSTPERYAEEVNLGIALGNERKNASRGVTTRLGWQLDVAHRDHMQRIERP